MIVAVRLLVGAGIAGAILLGLGLGFDIGALVILGFIVMFGSLAIAVTDKMRSGAVRPATCPSCGGLVSPNAPHCKHCGATF
ncbi:MAG: hypothetical protein ACRDLB_06010 [Actinomycetota bacterium]